MDTKMIGNKIAVARKKINMSQAGLAAHVFVSAQAVGKWERGESLPDVITLNQLAKILGVDLNYFSENQQPPEDVRLYKVAANGDVDQTKQKIADPSDPGELQLLTNFSGSDLVKSDFAGVKAHKSKFNGSALRGSDFTKADLTGSSFSGSDIRAANFEEANLTDCTLSVSDLTEARFNKAILVRTEFSRSALTGAKFSNAKLIDVKLTKTDLRQTIFENCVFDGVDFNYSDLSGLCFDKQVFTGVKFHNSALTDVSFNGATLNCVSFRSPYALTNRYYRAIKTIRFDDAMMDKLTYATLKGLGADLSKVTFI